MIGIHTESAEGKLFGCSKWWGFPDLPEELDWPTVPFEENGVRFYDPLTFLCQIRCEELAPYDAEGLLPHQGMLWFFAVLDYFLGDLDGICPGLGNWDPSCFRVFYAPDPGTLHEHTLVYEDGTPAVLPAEKLCFSRVEPGVDCYTRLLGYPFYEEVSNENPGMVSLLQIDEEDAWGLRFFDSGILNFLISPEDLAARRFSSVRVWLHSA